MSAPPPLVLRRPREREQEEFLRAHRATTPGTPGFLHYHAEGMPFARYLQVLEEQARGVNLPSDRHVPSTFLFAFIGDRIVGRVSIRHRLNEHLLREGGNIGYAVVPEFRRRGIATRILRQALRLAPVRTGTRRLLVTCDDDNIGSIRAIERNGGVLENIVMVPALPAPVRRYWIDAPGPLPGGSSDDLIRAERGADAASIDRVVADAFRTDGAREPVEPRIVRGLRDRGVLACSLVATVGGEIVGHAAFSPVSIEDGSTGWYGLGPIAVSPAHQRRGIGRALVEAGVREVRAPGAEGCVVLGDPRYYGRFGFRAGQGLTLPGVPAHCFQSISFDGQRPRGVVRYDDAFEGN